VITAGYLYSLLGHRAGANRPAIRRFGKKEKNVIYFYEHKAIVEWWIKNK